MVSQEVVIRTEDGYQVFVVENDGDVATAQGRSVELGPSFADRVVIADGLLDGDLLITVGHRLVDEGSRVAIVNAPEDGS